MYNLYRTESRVLHLGPRTAARGRLEKGRPESAAVGRDGVRALLAASALLGPAAGAGAAVLAPAVASVDAHFSGADGSVLVVVVGTLAGLPARTPPAAAGPASQEAASQKAAAQEAASQKAAAQEAAAQKAAALKAASQKAAAQEAAAQEAPAAADPRPFAQTFLLAPIAASARGASYFILTDTLRFLA